MQHSCVVAEHKAGKLSGSTLSAVAAAAALGMPITVLIAGENLAAAAAALAKVKGVQKVWRGDLGVWLTSPEPEPEPEATCRYW